MNSISQDMKFRYSLMKYVEKFGVSKACRKYNKCRSYIYFWKARFDGSIESLACHSRKPHSHPNQHTEEELILIRNMRRRNPKLASLNFGQDCGIAATHAVWKVCGECCVARGWQRKKSPGRSTNPSPTNRCSIPASASRSM